MLFLTVYLFSACTSTSAAGPGAPTKEPAVATSDKPRFPQLLKLVEQGLPGQAERYEAFLVAERLANKKEFQTAQILYQAVFDQAPSLVVGMKLARVLTLLGRNLEAENVIRKTHLLFPKDPQPMLAEAFLAQMRGAADESLSLYEKAYAEHPKDEEVAARYTEALLMTDKKTQAEKVLTRSIRDIPDSPYFLLKLARIRFQQKNFSQAKDLLDNLLRVDPDNIEAWTLAGFIALEEKKDEDAETYFRTAYEKQPENDTLAKYYIAQLLKLERLQEARRLLLRIEQSETEDASNETGSEATASDGDNDEISAPSPPQVDNDLKFQLAIVLFQLEDFENARIRFLNLAKNADDPGRLIYFAGQCDESTKKYTSAIELYSQIPQSSNFYVPALQRRIIALLELGRPDEGRSLLQEYASIAKKDENYYRFYASALSRLKEYKQALAIVRSAPEAERKTPELRYLEAVYLEFVESKDSSLAALEKLVKDHPNFSPALNHLGYTLVEMNSRIDFAIDLLKRATQLETKNGFFLDSLGWAYFKKGRLEEAEASLLRALELEPREPVILEHLGELKIKQERFDMAFRYFEQAMSLFDEAPKWKLESDDEWLASRKRVIKRLEELSEMALPKTTPPAKTIQKQDNETRKDP